MVCVGMGISCRRKIPFISTFGAFFTRVFDQIRIAGISKLNIKFVGSHVGVSIGEDGPTQMALEDIAMFRAIPGCTVLYPSDAVSSQHAIRIAAEDHGIHYIRTSRPATEVIYDNDHKFEVGKSYVVRKSESDQILIVSGGYTLQTSLFAAKQLEEAGVNVRVVDIFSVQPLDRATILENAKQAGNRILVVEDHYAQGGIFGKFY